MTAKIAILGADCIGQVHAHAVAATGNHLNNPQVAAGTIKPLTIAIAERNRN